MRPDECAVQVRVAAGDGGQGLERAESDRSNLRPGRVHPSRACRCILQERHKNFVAGATDRLGMFRLNGLPPGPLRIGI